MFESMKLYCIWNVKYGFSDTSEYSHGFEGCIYDMQIDNVYPLKRVFQVPRPGDIQLLPDAGICNLFLSLTIFN